MTRIILTGKRDLSKQCKGEKSPEQRNDVKVYHVNMCTCIHACRLIILRCTIAISGIFN